MSVLSYRVDIIHIIRMHGPCSNNVTENYKNYLLKSSECIHWQLQLAVVTVNQIRVKTNFSPFALTISIEWIFLSSFFVFC